MTDLPWGCPVEPPCPHPRVLHDWLEIDIDPSCCVEGCLCRGRTDEHTMIHKAVLPCP